MKRREFIAGLVGTVASPAFTPAALAQSTTKRVLLGYLSGTTQTEATPFIGLFLGGLREEGYVEGRDFDIAYRFADGHYDRLKLLAQQLVDLSPDVIITPRVISRRSRSGPPRSKSQS